MDYQLDRVLTEAQAANFLGLSHDTLRRLHFAGHLPRVKMSTRRIGYRLSALNAYLEARTESAVAPAGSTTAANGDETGDAA
jgi:excisionase family DNA binding protein